MLECAVLAAVSDHEPHFVERQTRPTHGQDEVPWNPVTITVEWLTTSPHEPFDLPCVMRG
ncbi:hypothetical protein NtRootA2_00370 [Arthrobacter sp. NtRootA2]|nr:hypothetical protein NtRootA2_00370 [Arthrobacter sp. NtRootA2]